MLANGAVLDGRYAIRGRLGAGGMGEVYRAERLRLGDEVAVKIVSATSEDPALLRDRFLRESRAAARLRHPHIVTILDFAIDEDGRPYLVMEYLNGPSLAEALATRGRFDLGTFRHVMASLCSALQLAHDCGFVHRDLKPTNVLSQRYESGEIVWKIIDFGVVTLLRGDSTRLTRSNQFLGTAAYAAPEQIEGQPVDARTDLYSLGMIAFEMLAGAHPFPGETLLATLEQQLNAAPPDLERLRPDLPPEVAAAVMRCLAKDPAARWPSASAFAHALATDAAPTMLVPAPTGAGLLATYEIGPVIGRGRFGSDIHEGLHRALGHPVAIRTFKPSPGVDRDAVRARFLAEARALQISHPNIVNVRDYGEQGETLYVITDLLEGCSLAELLERDGPCAAGRLHAFVGQLTDATGAIHRRGGFVSGLHPGIIRVVEDDGRERVAISSAGIGTVHDLLATLSEAALRGRAIANTELPYVAPEVLTGRPITIAADIFTIGVLAYEMATGRVPFHAGSLPELIGVMMQRAPARLESVRPDLPPGKVDAVHRALSIDPEARFTSADDMLTAWMGRGQER
jgi:serine/threonine protein kinase